MEMLLEAVRAKVRVGTACERWPYSDSLSYLLADMERRKQILRSHDRLPMLTRASVFGRSGASLRSLVAFHSGSTCFEVSELGIIELEARPYTAHRPFYTTDRRNMS